MTQADPNVELVARALSQCVDRTEDYWRDYETEANAVLAALNTRVEPTLHPLPSEEVIEENKWLRLIVRAYVDPTEVAADLAPLVQSVNDDFDAGGQRSTPTAPVQGDDAESSGPLNRYGHIVGCECSCCGDPDGSKAEFARLSGDSNAALVEARLRTFVLKLAKFDFPQTGEGSDGKRFAKALREIRRDARNLLDTLGDAK